MENKEQERARFARQMESIAGFLQNNGQALEFVNGFFFLTQVWDDLVDRDREVEPEEINRAFWIALVDMVRNPFFQANAAELAPVIRTYAADWFDANELERGTTHERTVAFTLRDRVGGLITQCAWLVGGYEWMRRVSPEIRRLIHDETLGTYLRGLR